MSRSDTPLQNLNLIELPHLRLDGGNYELPATETFHTDLIQSSVELGKDIGVITPTLHSGLLDYYALAALFQDMSSLTPVFIISPNTSIRDRYENLENGMQYSTAKWALATVKADKELSYRTQHVRSADAPPGVIFTRYSTRIPNDDISGDIRTVFYDDAVKFEDDRWERFQEWRSRNEIPSSVYFIRDPLGPVYQRIKNDLDAVWAWTPHALQSEIAKSTGSVNESEKTIPDCTRRERRLIQQKASGQTHQIHACTDGPVVDAFADLWDAFEELEDAAEDIDEKQLYAAVGVAKRAINGFTRLLSSLEYSDNYRSEHGKATTLSGRISQVKHIMDGLSGDAAAGRTPVEHVHYGLCELRDALTETNSQKWKRGAVLTAMQKVVDEDENLIIVLPDEPARQALQADLRIKRAGFHSEARRHIHLHTPRSLPNAEPADHLLLYGPPKYQHRWLLRTPQASHVGVLAYEHELGLLHSQVRLLNQEMRESTPNPTSEGLQSQLLETISAPRMFPDNDTFDIPDTLSPTDSGPYDGVTIDIPDPGNVESSFDTPFDDYELVERESDDSIEDLINGTIPAFDSDSAVYDPDTGSSGSNGQRNRAGTNRQVEGCVEVRVQDGKAVTLQSGDSLEVVDPDAGTTVKKPVSSIRPGEQVVAIEDQDAIRDSVEKLLLDSGHIDLIGYARLWKNQLHTEIERRGDSLDEFIKRLEDEGVNKRRSTYRAWYSGDIHLPRSKDSLHALARAYEMEEVLEEFENVWTANHKIRRIKSGFIDLLKQRSQEALMQDDGSDPVIDEELDIRLSDLDPTDDSGRPFVKVHTVTDIQDIGTVPLNSVGRWQSAV
ncbi:DrmE family protein [Halalkalicoccus subterraneus]|uniref:DrmE family protein n=1 Tax=Halalkalicoccus subterraneus TaxID=2675002 RepID=UPI000EFB7701|nr:DrmE family protein [Halalkalicoccus subterraneus]